MLLDTIQIIICLFLYLWCRKQEREIKELRGLLCKTADLLKTTNDRQTDLARSHQRLEDLIEWHKR